MEFRFEAAKSISLHRFVSYNDSPLSLLNSHGGMAGRGVWRDQV